MSPSAGAERYATRTRLSGFSMIELMASVVVLLIVSGAVMAGMTQMIRTQGTVANRTEMHSSVRSATELLQQEVGQAGRVSLPGAVTLTSPVPLPGTQIVGVSSTSGMFNGERLVVGTGANQETVTLSGISPSTNLIAASFLLTHAAGEPVAVLGGFPTGVVPTNVANGSTGSVLKLYGDINSDGNMVYIEYTCDTNARNLYRNVMPIAAAIKPALGSAQLLLTNVLPNPDNTPCFTYQQKTVTGTTFVLNVAITLTVQTQYKDPQTNRFQTETKALLNVAPRNVFEAWQLAGIGANSRLQPMPPSVMNLLRMQSVVTQ